MKKLFIFCGLLFISGFFIGRIDLIDHLLAFLFIGLVPYTEYSIPPLAMFFAWLSLPLILFVAVAIIRGLFILSLITAEHIDRSVVAYQLSRIENDKSSRLKVVFSKLQQNLKNRAEQISLPFKKRTS